MLNKLITQQLWFARRNIKLYMKLDENCTTKLLKKNHPRGWFFVIIKYMKLYLVRHGQTDWNLNHKAQGQTDIPLNATGIRQAEELGDKLKNYQFDKCYVSPLKRAAQTAEIAVGNRTEFIFLDDLKERCFGSLEGTNPKTWEGDNLDLKTNINFGGMESIKDLLARSKRVLERIKAENSADAKILIVGHGSFLKTMHFNIVGYTDETDFRSFRLENGDMAEYEI